MLQKEADEAKDLWEKEVVSRSKLGIRVRVTLYVSTSNLFFFLANSRECCESLFFLV